MTSVCLVAMCVLVFVSKQIFITQQASGEPKRFFGDSVDASLYKKNTRVANGNEDGGKMPISVLPVSGCVLWLLF